MTLAVRPVTDAVDLADLGEPAPALAAPAEVGTHPGGVPRREPSAQVAAQSVAGPPALRMVRDRHVLLEVEAAQALPGAVREDGHRVRRHAEHAGHLGRRVALHLGLPQHVPPALGQLTERGRGVRAFEPVQRRVGERLALVVAGQVVGELEPAVPARPVVADVPHGRVQVGAERHQRTAPGPQRGEHLGERLGDQVLGVGRIAGQAVRQLPGRRAVPLVQHAVGGGVAGADRGQQLGIRVFGPVRVVALPGIVIPASCSREWEERPDYRQA